MVMETEEDCLLFVSIGIQNNTSPEILEVSLYISANSSMSQMEGENIFKTPNKMPLFCCTDCFRCQQYFSQKKKKKYCISILHNMFSFGSL